jgi:hypothetical protein
LIDLFAAEVLLLLSTRSICLVAIDRSLPAAASRSVLSPMSIDLFAVDEINKLPYS